MHTHGFSLDFVTTGWLSPSAKWSKRNFSALPDGPETFVDGKFQYNATFWGAAEFDEEAEVQSVADSFTIPPLGFVVFRLTADNPGVWLFRQ